MKHFQNKQFSNMYNFSKIYFQFIGIFGLLLFSIHPNFIFWFIIIFRFADVFGSPFFLVPRFFFLFRFTWILVHYYFHFTWIVVHYYFWFTLILVPFSIHYYFRFTSIFNSLLFLVHRNFGSPLFSIHQYFWFNIIFGLPAFQFF